MGGALAIDLAARKSDLVDKVILVDAQGFKDGLGALQYLPDFLTKLFLEVLRSVPLRDAANKMSYFQKDMVSLSCCCAACGYPLLPSITTIALS